MENNINSNHANIGTNIIIPESVKINCEKLTIGNGVHLGENISIRAKNVYIGDHTFLGDFSNINLNGDIWIGEYTKIHKHALMNGKKNIKIGHNCWIGQNCILNGEDNLDIGNNVGIGTYSSIWTHGYFGELVEGCNYFNIKPTILEDDVWLVGSYNTVFPGVRIGSKSVIMGTSVITKDIPKNRTFGGNPAIDITNKLKLPYTEITIDKKKQIIKEYLLQYLDENNYNASTKANKIDILNKGEVYFEYDTDILNNTNVAIFDAIPDFVECKASLFCLKTKKYNKKNTELEIFMRKILNPFIARFIPL